MKTGLMTHMILAENAYCDTIYQKNVIIFFFCDSSMTNTNIHVHQNII